jgi:prepilin-type N-terminal cleavage/methylation domain-containing protein
MTRQPGQQNQTARRTGFTIIELMVVVSMIALLLGFSVPLVFKIDELSRDRTGVNTLGVAVTAARAYATRKIANIDSVPGAEYSGAAVLVTPYNQLRVIADLQVESYEAAGVSKFGHDLQTIRLETIAMPRGVGIAGIGRDGAAANGLKLLAPPFAIRFNRQGQLVSEIRSGSNDPAILRNIVYYDGNLDGNMGEPKLNAGPPASVTFNPPIMLRPGAYNPNTSDPDFQSIQGRWVVGAGEYKMDFEALETVIGVVTYSKADFDDAGGRFPSTVPTLGCKDGSCGSINEWMFDNGTVLFFSPYSGNIIRAKVQ